MYLKLNLEIMASMCKKCIILLFSYHRMAEAPVVCRKVLTQKLTQAIGR